MRAATAAAVLVAAVALPSSAQLPAVPVFGLGGFEQGDPVSITADHLEARDRGQRRRLTFRRNVLVRQGELTLRADRLEAVYGPGSPEPRSLKALGGIRIEEGSRRATCSEASYDREGRSLECRGEPAEVWDGADHLSGSAIRFDLAGHRVTVEGSPRAEIHRAWLPDAAGEEAEPADRPTQPVSLRGERIEAREQDGAREIHFLGDVVVTRGGLELRADELVLDFPAGADRPQRLRARGDVLAQEGGREARCAEAEYRPGARTLVCSGRARLRDGADRLASDEIRLDLDSGRVDATGSALLQIRSGGRSS